MKMSFFPRKFAFSSSLQILVSQHGQFGAIPSPPFLSLSPLVSMWSGGAIPPPPQKGYLSGTYVIPLENKAKLVQYPLALTKVRLPKHDLHFHGTILFLRAPFLQCIAGRKGHCQGKTFLGLSPDSAIRSRKGIVRYGGYLREKLKGNN